MVCRAIPQRNNTSGIPGLRLRHRYTRTGLLRWFIEVSWQRPGAKRAGTSIPVRPDDYLKATLRALIIRKTHGGHVEHLSARRAWSMMADAYLGRRHG